ncbi:hypothetical protein [Lentibacillus jeotgali]|uniref:hypothetical protein n=1 Tax=Lentibacillus jeotgali TaxID=558169 RepID=UPI001584D566|nr:hypothetical protein [Lentibacillus jeotgali]
MEAETITKQPVKLKRRKRKLLLTVLWILAAIGIVLLIFVNVYINRSSDATGIMIR